MMNAADRAMAEAIQAEIVDLKQRFHNLQHSLTPDHPYRYFMTIPDGRRQFWIHNYSTPTNGPLAGVVRFKESALTGETRADGGHWKNVPSILRSRPQWIWLSPSHTKSNPTRKTPHLCRGVKEHEGLVKKNWLKFSSPLGVGTDVNGIAYVLTDEVIHHESQLVAIVVNKESGISYAEALDFWETLDRPYLEHSIDGTGWTILGLTRHHVPPFEGQGVKIFSRGDYVELCGLGAIGALRDITDEIAAFAAYRIKPPSSQNLSFPPRPETPRAVATLTEQLKFISADCHYETYRQVVWAILSTLWSCAEDTALEWSKTAPLRFDQNCFDNLVRSFDPSKAKCPTLGSIYHHARSGGWCGS